MERDGDHAEIQDLDRGPEHEIGLQCRQVDVLKLPRHSPPATTLGDGHEGEKRREPYTSLSAQLLFGGMDLAFNNKVGGLTHRRKDQLIKAHPL